LRYEVLTVIDIHIIIVVWDVTLRTLVQCVHIIVSLRSAAITVTTREFKVTTLQSWGLG